VIKTSLGGGIAFIPSICEAHLIAWSLIDLSVLSFLFSRIHKHEFLLSLCIKVVSEHKPGECSWFALFSHLVSYPKPTFPIKHKEPYNLQTHTHPQRTETTQTAIGIRVKTMSGSKGGGIPNPRIPLGLNLEQARELGRGNAIHQLQQNYQVL